jgi:hypothetical protein
MSWDAALMRRTVVAVHPRKYRKNGDWLSMTFLKFRDASARVAPTAPLHRSKTGQYDLPFA